MSNQYFLMIKEENAGEKFMVIHSPLYEISLNFVSINEHKDWEQYRKGCFESKDNKFGFGHIKCTWKP